MGLLVLNRVALLRKRPGSSGAERLRSIVARENADIVFQTWQHGRETHHSGFTHFDMKIAQV